MPTMLETVEPFSKWNRSTLRFACNEERANATVALLPDSRTKAFSPQTPTHPVECCESYQSPQVGTDSLPRLSTNRLSKGWHEYAVNQRMMSGVNADRKARIDDLDELQGNSHTVQVAIACLRVFMQIKSNIKNAL